MCVWAQLSEQIAASKVASVPLEALSDMSFNAWSMVGSAALAQHSNFPAARCVNAVLTGVSAAVVSVLACWTLAPCDGGVHREGE